MTYEAEEVLAGHWVVDPTPRHPGADLYESVAAGPDSPTIEESA